MEEKSRYELGYCAALEKIKSVNHGETIDFLDELSEWADDHEYCHGWNACLRNKTKLVSVETEKFWFPGAIRAFSDADSFLDFCEIIVDSDFYFTRKSVDNKFMHTYTSEGNIDYFDEDEIKIRTVSANPDSEVQEVLTIAHISVITEKATKKFYNQYNIELAKEILQTIANEESGPVWKIVTEKTAALKLVQEIADYDINKVYVAYRKLAQAWIEQEESLDFEYLEDLYELELLIGGEKAIEIKFSIVEEMEA